MLQVGMCAHRRVRSVCASAQTDLFPLWAPCGKPRQGRSLSKIQGTYLWNWLIACGKGTYTNIGDPDEMRRLINVRAVC